jgi:hypothetical protein
MESAERRQIGETHDGERARQYRGRSTAGTAWVFTFMGVCIALAGASYATGWHEAHRNVVGGSVFGAFGAALLLWTWFWFVHMGVVASEDGIVIRNFFRRTSVQWADIKAFKFGDDLENPSLKEDFATPDLTTYVVLKNGRHITMSGISATRIHTSLSRERVHEMLDALQQELRVHQDSIAAQRSEADR